MKHERRWFLLLLIFAASFIFYKLGTNHLIEYDEAIYGVVAKNILKTGDWVTLTWRYGLPWYDKGPFGLWLMAIALKIFGNTAFAVRFWTAVLCLLSIAIVYFLGRKLYNPTTGLISGIVLASTTGYLYYGRNGMLDVSTAALTAFSMLFLWLGRSRPKFWLPAAIFTAFAVLTRGLLGFLGIASFALFAIFDRPWKKYFNRYLFFSFLVFLLIAVPWHYLMYLRHGNEFIYTYLVHQMFERFSQTIEGKYAPTFWYLTVIRTQFRIWFVVLVPALIYALFEILLNSRHSEAEDRRISRGSFPLDSARGQDDVGDERQPILLLLLWSGLTFVVFTFAKSKLIWYIMPIYPPLALLVGRFLERLISGGEFSLRLLGFRNYQKLRTFLLALIFIIAGFYNVRVWPRILPQDFSRDLVAVVEKKNELDYEAPLVSAGQGYSVLAFYSGGEVWEAPKESFLEIAKQNNTRYAIISKSDLVQHQESILDSELRELFNSGELVLIELI